eukprot:10409635-Ditylum_brightwellii.AAC.1
MKCQRKTENEKNTHLNGTPYNGYGTKTVGFETPPSNVPQSEEQEGKHPTMSLCAIDQLQNQPVSESTQEETDNLEEDGLESVDANATNSATDAVIEQISETND